MPGTCGPGTESWVVVALGILSPADCLCRSWYISSLQESFGLECCQEPREAGGIGWKAEIEAEPGPAGLLGKEEDRAVGITVSLSLSEGECILPDQSPCTPQVGMCPCHV